MQRHFKISQVLIYYDIPELIVATDQIGTDYISILFDVVDNQAKYYAVPISPKRLSYFIKGQIDLRQLLIEPEVRELYLLTTGDDKVVGQLQIEEVLPEQYLPEEGFTLNNEIRDDSTIVEEVISKENAVVHLGISDENDSYSIDADDLGIVINLYSGIIENSFKKSLSEHSFKAKEKKAVIIPINYKMRAFAASRASFNVHLYSSSQKDLFGNCLIEFGLEKVDQLFSDYQDEAQYIDTLKSLKGHTISKFRSVLKKIIDDKLKLKHKWFAPNRKEVSYNEIDASKAKNIFNILNQSVELIEEIRDITGVFVQADVERGTWRIKSIEDGIEYSGEAPQAFLTGITLETVVYKLTCQEVVEEFQVTEKEKIKYIFKSVSEVKE